MKVNTFDMPGVYEFITPKFEDDRGHFSITFDEGAFEKAGVPTNFVQDNQSFSVKGTLRGLHYQHPPHAQGKLVRVIKGKVQDVIVDMRFGSPTFGQWKSFYVSEELGNQLYVPEGFAHGFLALEDSIFAYKCTRLYSKESEGGVRWDDADLNINWDITDEIDLKVSPKDEILTTFKDATAKIAALIPGPAGHTDSCTVNGNTMWKHLCFCGGYQFSFD